MFQSTFPLVFTKYFWNESKILDFLNCVQCCLQNGKDDDYDDDYDDIIANAGAKVAQFIRVATEKGKNCKQTADV